MNNYWIHNLLQRFGITPDRIKELKVIHSELEISMITYFMCVESPLLKKWESEYNYYMSSATDDPTDMSNYICDSNYSAYCDFRSLKSRILDLIGPELFVKILPGYPLP